VIRGDATAGGGGVRRLRVVDPANAAELTHELEPVRHAGERAEGLGDRLVGDTGDVGGGGRGGSVLAVVAARDERFGGQLVVGGELDPGQAEVARHNR